jgi:hypothetical protein
MHGGVMFEWDFAPKKVRYRCQWQRLCIVEDGRRILFEIFRLLASDNKSATTATWQPLRRVKLSLAKHPYPDYNLLSLSRSSTMTIQFSLNVLKRGTWNISCNRHDFQTKRDEEPAVIDCYD